MNERQREREREIIRKSLLSCSNPQELLMALNSLCKNSKLLEQKGCVHSLIIIFPLSKIGVK
jgi:hypothetical protein